MYQVLVPQGQWIQTPKRMSIIISDVLPGLTLTNPSGLRMHIYWFRFFLFFYHYHSRYYYLVPGTRLLVPLCGSRLPDTTTTTTTTTTNRCLGAIAFNLVRQEFCSLLDDSEAYIEADIPDI